MSAAAKAANYVLTLEIKNLTRKAANPPRLDERGGPDCEAVPHRCLLGLSGARSRELVLAATLGTARMHRLCASPFTKALRDWWPEQVHAVAVDRVSQHPRFKFFARIGRGKVSIVSGCPAGRSGFCRAFSSCRRSMRIFEQEDIRMLMEAAAQVAPVVSRGTCSTGLSLPRRGLWALARNLWWTWDHDCVSLFPGSGCCPLPGTRQ